MVYAILACPTLYSGQTVETRITADSRNTDAVTVAPYVYAFGPDDELFMIRGSEKMMPGGSSHTFSWKIPDTEGAPIAKVGVEVSHTSITNGAIYLDYLTWTGAPDVRLGRIRGHQGKSRLGEMWRRAFVYGMDDQGWNGFYKLFRKIAKKMGIDETVDMAFFETFRMVQNEGRGLLIQGARDWTDYRVSAEITPHMVEKAGVGARVQGLRRYYALVLAKGGKVQLIKALDGDTILQEVEHDWALGAPHQMELQVVGNRCQGWINGELLIDVTDDDRPLTGGAAALVTQIGRMATNEIVISPPR